MKSQCYKDIPLGTRYGKLVSGPFVGFNERRNAMFEFTCDCGNKKTLPGSLVRLGDIKSCGCLPAERMKTLSASLAEDHTGKRFGKLVVLSRLSERDSSGGFLYNCRCDCGNECKVVAHMLTSGARTSCKKWACREDFSRVLDEISRPPADVASDAYLSGHFDGEGNICFQGESYFPHIVVRVNNCFKPVVERYKSTFGGTIRMIPLRTRMLRVQWGWQASAQHEVFRFICRILPYSMEKREQLQLAKDYMLRRIQSHKYNAGEALQLEIPAIKARMSELKNFEFKN